MYAREYRSTRPHKAIFFHLSCLTLICSAQVYAKPDMRPLGPNIADKGSVFYHFSATSFDSVDGTRHYRVWTAVPNTTAPASGYPILYMLDGNAVMDRLDDELLKQLSEKTPPVIVAVGYQTNLPFDLNSRAYDYTPAAESRKTDLHSGRFSRKSGGSNNFRQLLETRIAPKVEQGLNIDRQRRGPSLDDYYNGSIAAAYGGTPTAASSCWIPGCPPLTSGRTTAPARRWAEVMMLC